MNQLLEGWALLNNVVIMLALGMAYRPAPGQLQTAVMVRTAIGYNLLIPLAGLFAVGSFTSWFTVETLSAMSLCIASAGGTSAGAFVQKIGASATFTAKLIIILLGLSLGVITGLSVTESLDFGQQSIGHLGAYLLLITLGPFMAGTLLTRFLPQLSHRWHPRVDRFGSLLVILLIIVLLWRYGREILAGPAEPLWAAAALVLLFVLPPLLLEKESVLRRTIVIMTLIRNLTLALSLLTLMPSARELLPTVLAYGLAMYLMSGGLLFYWQKKGE